LVGTLRRRKPPTNTVIVCARQPWGSRMEQTPAVASNPIGTCQLLIMCT
jgi:hypothetical protein